MTIKKFRSFQDANDEPNFFPTGDAGIAAMALLVKAAEVFFKKQPGRNARNFGRRMTTQEWQRSRGND